MWSGESILCVCTAVDTETHVDLSAWFNVSPAVLVAADFHSYDISYSNLQAQPSVSGSVYYITYYSSI